MIIVSDTTPLMTLLKCDHLDLLLMDEVMGRMIAKEMGFTIAGAIGILIAAKTEGFLSADEIKITVSKLRSSGQHIGESLLKKLLESN